MALNPPQGSREDTLQLSPPTASEVMRVIGSLGWTGATGVDWITVSVPQLAALIIVFLITHLIAHPQG